MFFKQEQMYLKREQYDLEYKLKKRVTNDSLRS